MIKSIGTVKRGDTFGFTVEMRDGPTGGALVGAADKLRCQGRYDWFGEVLVEMNITETDTPGTYVFRTDSTAGWRPGKTVLFDIEYNDGGVVSSTQTFTVKVEADITYD